MNKDHLLGGRCKALGLEMHAHTAVKGIAKAATKAMIKDWQKKRDEALVARDRKALKAAMDQIHHLKRKMRKAMVKTPVPTTAKTPVPTAPPRSASPSRWAKCHKVAA